ncbi:MAG: hypothetical protein IJD70_00715 [Clostridia bacterium]|nr:hypothetical protein [Clostridia bacterium]
MKKEEMNRILGMLDDDVIADALGEKKTAGKVGVSRRKFMTALIAATLAVVILVGGVAAAFALRGNGEPQSLLPPEGAVIIRNVTSSAQLTAGTVYTSGEYYSVESAFADVAPDKYAVVNQLELDQELYESMVSSNDENRTWAVEVTVSPNLYMSKEYIERETAYWLSKYEMADLEALAGIYDQFKSDFDINAIYEQYKDRYEIDELYRYFASGELETDLLNADINAMSKKAEELWDECVHFTNGFWRNIADDVREMLDDFGIEFIEDNNRFIIFVTEGELMALEGLGGVKFSKAGKYDINAGVIERSIEWNGKIVSKKLHDAIAANEGKDVLFAVTAEPAVFGDMLDRSEYESKYVALFGEAAKRPAWRTALEAAAADGSLVSAAIELCGEDAVAKYLKDGVFDSALFDSDTSAINGEIELMRKNLYRDSQEVYKELLPHVRYIEITASGNVVIYVSAEELASMKLNGDYCFKLAA